MNDAFRVVERGSMIYVEGEGTQSKQVLERIDRLLASAGVDKSRLLTAQVWLADMSLRAEHEVAWNDWVDPRHPPLRVFRPAEPRRPAALVGILVTAAK